MGNLLFLKKQHKVVQETILEEVKYDIISHEENFEGTGKIYLKVRIKNTRNTFYQPVEQLYQKEWINDFSKEDGAFIAMLFFSEKHRVPELITNFPRKKQQLTNSVILLGMLFVSFLTLSNFTASKIVGVNISFLSVDKYTVIFPAALVFFPLTYFLDNTLTEVYGFRISRFIIWSGLICNTLVSVGTWVSIHLTPASFWENQGAYALVLGSTYRIFIASILATFFGEFCNAIILSKIKVLTSGKWLWIRVVTSSSCAVAIDSCIFCCISFYGNVSHAVLVKMILTQYLLKIFYELIALPLTYLITGYLKRKDQIDYYDYGTSFNPFSLKL